MNKLSVKIEGEIVMELVQAMTDMVETLADIKRELNLIVQEVDKLSEMIDNEERLSRKVQNFEI
jgi:hypothetical protein